MKQSFLLCGLGYGDESKGATTDAICQKYGPCLVVRYNGGSQASHAVVQPDGREHRFAQFGAGMFHPAVRTHLSRFMLVSPSNQMREAEALQKVGIKDVWERTTVDEQALIVTPLHRSLNRVLEEHRGANAHGSCGQGIGVCREFHLTYGDQVLFASDLQDRDRALKKLRFIQQKALGIAISLGDYQLETVPLRDAEAPEMLYEWYLDWPAKIISAKESAELIAKQETVIFEGAQGVMLDETYGTAPYNTWTDTTLRNAVMLLDECGWTGERHRIGVIRSYYTRHGAGPFPTEDQKLYFDEPHNDDKGFQGRFRRGHFDEKAFRYAISVCGGVDYIALNHLDQLPLVLPADLEAKIILRGYGPTYKDRVWKEEL